MRHCQRVRRGSLFRITLFLEGLAELARVSEEIMKKENGSDLTENCFLERGKIRSCGTNIVILKLIVYWNFFPRCALKKKEIDERHMHGCDLTENCDFE